MHFFQLEIPKKSGTFQVKSVSLRPKAVLLTPMEAKRTKDEKASTESTHAVLLRTDLEHKRCYRYIYVRCGRGFGATLQCCPFMD